MDLRLQIYSSSSRSLMFLLGAKVLFPLLLSRFIFYRNWFYYLNYRYSYHFVNHQRPHSAPLSTRDPWGLPTQEFWSESIVLCWTLTKMLTVAFLFPSFTAGGYECLGLSPQLSSTELTIDSTSIPVPIPPPLCPLTLATSLLFLPTFNHHFIPSAFYSIF